jgi:hypothetical protein
VDVGTVALSDGSISVARLGWLARSSRDRAKGGVGETDLSRTSRLFVRDGAADRLPNELGGALRPVAWGALAGERPAVPGAGGERDSYV